MSRRKPQTLDEMTADYARHNEQLEDKYGKVESMPPPPTEAGYAIHCSVCHKEGPRAPTIYEGAMRAQQQGFTYDSTSLRVGKKVTWYCERHKR